MTGYCWRSATEQQPLNISCFQTNFRKPAVLHPGKSLLIRRGRGKEKALWQKVDFFWLLLLQWCTTNLPPDALLDCATTTISHFIIGTIVVIVFSLQSCMNLDTIWLNLSKASWSNQTDELGPSRQSRLPNWGRQGFSNFQVQIIYTPCSSTIYIHIKVYFLGKPLEKWSMFLLCLIRVPNLVFLDTLLIEIINFCCDQQTLPTSYRPYVVERYFQP